LYAMIYSLNKVQLSFAEHTSSIQGLSDTDSKL